MNPPSMPIPRTRLVEKRESALRASILDTALELGVGSSRTVTHWMFNPIGEEDEEAESTLSPSLTYASTAPSDDSWLSQSSSFNRHPSSSSSNAGPSQSKSHSPVDVPSPQQHSVQFQPGPPRASNVSTPEPQAPASKQRKLRKAKHDGNGYESDGGYVSDVVSKGKKKKKDSKSKGDGGATGEESDGGYLSEVLARRRRKKKEQKERESEAKGVAEDELEGGYQSSHSKKEKSKKSSGTQGDESDGGYVSESSKRRRFIFRMNNKSRKRQDSSDVSPEDVVPPVPSLPPLALPIADRFATSISSEMSPSASNTASSNDCRSETPNTYGSRADTPAYSFLERASTQRSSDERSSMADNPSRGPTPISLATPLASPNPSIMGLTSAFNDAQSVRTPSTDILRAFGRQALTTSPRSPLSSSSSAMDLPPPSKEEYSVPPSFTVPTMGMPPPKRNPSQKRVPPQISTPNTQSLSVRTQNSLTSAPDTSIPMTLTPPTPTPGTRWRLGKMPERKDGMPSPALSTHTLPITPVSSNFDSVPSSPSGATPSESAYPSPLPSPGVTNSPNPSSQFAIRPTALSKYDIPPPSPPPAGPLPQPPTSAGPSILALREGKGRHGRPGTADSDTSISFGVTGLRMLRSVSPQPKSAPTGPLPPPPMSPARSHSQLSGQNSAPPVTPLLPVAISPPSPPGSEGVAPLFLQRIPSRQRGKDPPFPSHPLVSRTRSQLDMQQPMSAGGVLDEAHLQREQQAKLHAIWQPRSASALDQRQADSSSTDDRRSWVDFDDNRDSASFHSTSSHPDIEIDSVLESLQDHPEDVRPGLYDPRSTEGNDEDDCSRYPDDEDNLDNRYSVFSDSDDRSRISILDKERSSDVRQKFLKRIEEMYSKEGIAKGMVPPVPNLPSPSSPRRK